MRFEAEFVCSAATLAECPRWNRSEIALVGRSNVGKSSLLNALTRQRNLARISKTPGCTRLLNFFAVGKERALVDLPGYGYAKIAHREAERIASLIQEYLQQRLALRVIVLLIDARRGPRDEELALVDHMRDPRWRSGHRPGLIIAATKSDKLKRDHRKSVSQLFEAVGDLPLFCSARTGEGLEQLRHRILELSSRADNQGAEDAVA